jgi:type III secretion protein J
MNSILSFKISAFVYFKRHLPLSKIIFLFCCLFALTSCESRKTIVNSLDEREANEILVFLAAKGIDANKVQSVAAASGGGGPKIVLWDISVPNDQSLEAMSLLNQAGLPRLPSRNLLNIFTGSGLVPSEMEQKIRYQAGLADQIASVIRKIDGVLDADVQISFPEENPLNPAENKQPITAAVWVKNNGVLDDPNLHLVSKIKRLVAASVPGLNYNNVTVVGERVHFNLLPASPSESEEEKHWVSIWSVVLAKDSVSLFRTILFSFTFALLILVLVLAWLLWKIFPILHAHGLKELFHLKPLSAAHPPEAAPPAESETKIEEKEKDAENVADKNIDQT